MQVQRCPSCREKNDVSVYVHGQTTRCVRCGIRFQVDRESPQSNPAERLPSPPPAGGQDFRPTEISLVRGGVDELVPTAGPLPAAALAGLDPLGSIPPLNPAPPPPVPAPAAPLSSGQLFPTPVQRPNAPERSPAADPAPAPDKSRPNIPGYECTQLLGRGGMGEVWKAQQLSLARTVAVKLLSPTLAVEPDFVRRFERESTALAALAHPHIVSVFDRGSANGHWFFIMEFVEGRSLRDRMADAPIARTDLLRLMAEVARAVDYAHQKNVVHRDLKPENILIDQLGNAKVADFGLAGMSEVGRSSLTMSAVAMGTAHYMAPEQRKDAKKVDGRADLYSIGVMLYEFMTGELPAGRFQTPREKVPTVDPRLDAMILKLLDQDPLKRPAKASEVADLLERLVAEERGEKHVVVAEPQHTKVLSNVVREVRQSPQKKAMAAGAALLLLLVLVLAIVKGGGGGARTRLAARVDRPQAGRASVVFGDGAADGVLAVGDGWQISGESLVRESVNVPPEGEPRAYLMGVRLDYTDARVETDVEVAELGTTPPRVELVLYADADRYVGLRMAMAEDASFTLFHSTQLKGKTIRQESEGAQDIEPKPGKPYHLELYVVDGRVSAFVDKKQVASAAVTGLNGVKAKPALGCRGECRFTNLKFAGALADPPSATSAQK